MKFGAALVLMIAIVCVARAADQCTTDTDCAPASCCHSTMCVPTTSAPKCPTPNTCDPCAPFTLDCGGSCKCNTATNKCEGHLAGGHGNFFATKHRRYTYIHVRVRGKPKNKH
jgi:hypothetical protein